MSAFVDYPLHVETCHEDQGQLVVIATTAKDLDDHTRQVSTITQLIKLAAYRHRERNR